MKKIIAVFLSAVLALSFAGCTPKEYEGFRVYDSQGAEIAVIKSLPLDSAKLSDPLLAAYIDIAFAEAAEAISAEQRVSLEKAEKILLGGYGIWTNLDSSFYSAIKGALNEGEDLQLGCAVTNLNGALIAAYSAGEEGRNFAAMRTQPYSSLKPLAIYMQGIEDGKINYSSAYMDSPIKTVTNAEGAASDWPSNADGKYLNKDVAMSYAIKRSLNTVAVRCLTDIGLENSVDYLINKLGMPLEFEAERIKNVGAEEVVGSVALGYIYNGVSPVDMAGYYQCFANGGKYAEPTAVRKICDKSGRLIFENKAEPEQLIKPETAFIMNSLLQKVVSPEGTGAKAAIKGVPAGGKTGTGENGNWFVGFTPQYSCAVWHGSGLGKNNAAQMFANIMSSAESDKNMKYPSCDKVRQALYCKVSGGLVSAGCAEAEMGYYISDNLPEKCKIHS